MKTGNPENADRSIEANCKYFIYSFFLPSQLFANFYFITLEDLVRQFQIVSGIDINRIAEEFFNGYK